MDHNVGTLTPCRLAVIPHQTLQQITEHHPRIARAIWKDTLVDAAIFREWMASIGRRSALERIAHLMCELITKLQIVGLAAGHTIDWPITQIELADALGLSPVHVNRTLQDLRRDRLITLNAGRLVVHRWEELKQISMFTPRYLHFQPPQVGQSAQAR
jgi:CRP-like cAMP-binding protein